MNCYKELTVCLEYLHSHDVNGQSNIHSPTFKSSPVLPPLSTNVPQEQIRVCNQ